MREWLGPFLGGFRWGMLSTSLAFLAISTVMFFNGEFWPWGWAVGGVLLLFSRESDSEKKGYRF